MKKTPLQPAYGVVLILGGAVEVAAYLKRNKTTVYRWMKSEADGGTGGLIPAEYHEPLLSWGRSLGKPITAEMFIRCDHKLTNVTSEQRIVA